MDDSISIDEGDSLFSVPGAGPSAARALYHTPPQSIVNAAPPVGLGLHPSVVPQHLPEYDESFEAPNRWDRTGASPAAEEASIEYGLNSEEELEGGNGNDDEGEGEEDDEGYAHSESSSAQYDPDADPEGFAQRLDELAGVLEVGEEEARAVRWGPAVGKEREAPGLPLGDFKNLINHHLTSTEWRFSPPALMLPTIPGRPSTTSALAAMDLLNDTGDMHPIRVLGRGWVEMDDELHTEDEYDPMSSPVRGQVGGLFAGH
ncbi:hypothetical protein I316_07895 [Kwoniella heveanensis BCC8398]|uniref:Uncharacterized protein n=1 Tax=Kwoniella heveanensis BCC8398 TaxID=1296120 RepID=A0A1B9GHD9_9TREE|nr:hypothetical protein I316_07895 [Kwoniella heveanensis BCC8398]